MTLSSSFSFFRLAPTPAQITFKCWKTANHRTLNSSKTEIICSLVLVINLTKSTTPYTTPTLLETLASYSMNISPFLTIISSVSTSSYYHIRQLCCIRPYLDTKTTSTIAISIFHSKLDYCNSLYRNLPKSQKTRLQQIQNSLARAVVKASNSSHITPILPSLHWLKITLQCALNTSSSDLCTKFSQPPNLHICISS